MIDLNEPTSGNETAHRAPAPENRSAAEAPPNGKPAPAGAAGQAEAGPATAAGDTPPSGADRAEELVDRVSQRVAYLASVGTRKLVVFTSRAREALQDFWAEVQDFRHGRKG
jgi:hypothetical protein